MSGLPPILNPEQPRYGVNGRFGLHVVCPCGQAFTAQPSKYAAGLSRFCSEKCSGLAHRKVRRDHYIGWRNGQREHVIVVEEAIGRALVKGEQVHHANEVKSDNRLENLVLCASRRSHTILHVLPALLSQATAMHGVRCFDLDAVTPAGLRYCTVCGLAKPIADFGASSKYADGRRSECRECRRVTR